MENHSNVKIDLNLFIQERKSKVWSQQHLADVAGVSLRTIQRIEKTGVMSAESLKAISSAYEKKPSFFLEVEKVNQEYNKPVIIGLVVGIIILITLASNLFSISKPEKVTFEVIYKAELLKSGDINEGTWLVELDMNNEITLNLPHDFELVLSPYLSRDNVALIDVTLDYQSNIPFIPNTTPTTITNSLKEGITLRHEIEGEIVAAINIALVES